MLLFYINKILCSTNFVFVLFNSLISQLNYRFIIYAPVFFLKTFYTIKKIAIFLYICFYYKPNTYTCTYVCNSKSGKEDYYDFQL